MRSFLVSRALSVLVRRSRSLLAFLAAGLVLSAQGAYRFKTYGPDQGLTNLATTCLAQDATGYIWVGTEGGAFRYDGQQFRKFAQAEGLDSPLVSDIVALGEGITLAFTDSGLRSFDGRRFKPVEGRAFKPGERPCFALDRDGALLMGAFDSLTRSRDRGRTFEPVPGVPAGAITALWVDPATGAIHAVQRDGVPGNPVKGLYHLLKGVPEGGGHRWERRDLPRPLQEDRYGQLLRDGLGRFWVRGTRHLLRLPAWDAPPVDLLPTLPNRPATSPQSLVLDREGRVWTHTDAWLVCFEGDTQRLVGEAEGLPTTWSNALLVDREGSLWMASEGVHRLQGGFVWEGYTRKQGLPIDAAWSLHRDRGGRLWAATLRGLARLEGNRFVIHPGTQDLRLDALAEDGEGALWAGGSRNLQDGKQRLHRLPAGAAGPPEIIPVPGIGEALVNTLAADPAGGLWIATDGMGLHRLWRKGETWATERAPLPCEAAELKVARVRVANGLVWAASNRGISVLERGVWSHLSKKDGLLEDSVYTLVQDREGRIWFGYYHERGLGRLERGPGGWRVAGHVQEPAALFDDDIVSLEAAPDGTLWLGTTEGVKRWKDDRFEGFNRSRGLPGEDCVGQAMLVEPGGDVWVGTSSGIARFNAKAYRGPVPVPPARITLIKDGGGKVHEPSPEALEVAYRFRSMDFEFECLSFVDEAHLRPEVRLMGFEDPWRDAGGRATRFTTLPPGRYVFAVRFVDANGQPGPEATQAIFVLKPWWQTWWFFGLLALALAALVGALVRWRTNLLKRRTRELEKIVERRTHDLQAANQALEEASMADALTGLKNRRYLQLYLPEDEAQVQRAYRTAASQNAPARGEDLGLLLVDLDHFKAVNDTHGHAAGDAVLKQAAELLLGVCRETDAVARWGGEEFLVVARRVERGAMDSIARKIRDAFENHPFVLPDGGVIRKTCSLGFAVHPLNPLDPGAFRWEETLEAADLCLYAAKKSGRNAWVGVFGDPERHGDPGPMRVVDLPELVRADRLELRSSLPADEINWSA